MSEQGRSKKPDGEYQYRRPETPFSDVLSFRKMIAPLLAKIFFWVGTTVSFIFGIVSLTKSGWFSSDGTFMMVLTFFVICPAILRIWSELVVLIFRMNTTLAAIRKNTQSPVDTGSDSSEAEELDDDTKIG
tara:strand:- start:153 stop:545 length:393 start_codon:yes stop_codon:yes gene_type:complete